MTERATDRARRISRLEQEHMGLTRTGRGGNTYVPATRHAAPLPAATHHQTTMAVDHPAHQEIIVQTSAVDRAKGYQIVITPLAIAFGLLVVFVSLAFDNEFFSLASLILFWITFCACWLIGWGITIFGTPEFVSWYSAKRQWDIIEREQDERWAHYKWEAGRE